MLVDVKKTIAIESIPINILDESLELGMELPIAIPDIVELGMVLSIVIPDIDIAIDMEVDMVLLV